MHMTEFGSSSLALTLSKVDVSNADMLDECFSPCQKRAEVQQQQLEKRGSCSRCEAAKSLTSQSCWNWDKAVQQGSKQEAGGRNQKDRPGGETDRRTDGRAQRGRIAKTDMSAGKPKEAVCQTAEATFPQFSAVSEQCSQVTVAAVKKVHWESYQR